MCIRGINWGWFQDMHRQLPGQARCKSCSLNHTFFLWWSCVLNIKFQSHQRSISAYLCFAIDSLCDVILSWWIQMFLVGIIRWVIPILNTCSHRNRMWLSDESTEVADTSAFTPTFPQHTNIVLTWTTHKKNTQAQRSLRQIKLYLAKCQLKCRHSTSGLNWL